MISDIALITKQALRLRRRRRPRSKDLYYQRKSSPEQTSPDHSSVSHVSVCFDMSVTKVLFRESVREQDDSVRLFDSVLTLCDKLSGRNENGGGENNNLDKELKKLTNLLGKWHRGDGHLNFFSSLSRGIPFPSPQRPRNLPLIISCVQTRPILDQSR